MAILNVVNGRNTTLNLTGLHDKHYLKLSSNENVLGPSPQALAALAAALPETHRYPGEDEAILLQKLAAHIGPGLSAEHFIVGNGSSDVLRTIAQTWLRPGSKAVIAAPTFALYSKLITTFDSQPVIAPLHNYAVDLGAVLDAIDAQTRLVFICNPNNPTGTFVTHAEVGAFLAALPPHVTAVFDEAYAEFADDPRFPRMAEYIQAGYNLVVTRTFSKLYGLAGLRVGYCFGRTDLIAQMRSRQFPFYCSHLAYRGAAAALDDEAFIARSLALVRSGRADYQRALPTLGLRQLPNQSNFIFLSDLPCPATTICAQALQQGVMLRRTEAFNLPDNVRITLAHPQENAQVIELLRQICR